MDTFEAIRQRRAIKHFDPHHQLSPAEFEQLVDLAAQAPSSFNLQHWRIVHVKDTALRQQLREAANNQAQVTEASLLFVITADIDAWKKDPARYWVNAPKAVQDILVPWIDPFYSGKEQLQRDEAMRSVGIMLQTLMLAAKAMDYDSCPMVGFDFDRVAQLINLPEGHAVGAMLVIGKAVKPAWPKPGYLPRQDMIITDRF
ncbi:MAG: reductase DrgA [Ferrovum sp. 37-45-19]|jgi:nitroreductase|uniref:nitroreductase family protein n=1 Tax=Ferrovum sp. JA12 TaxID=1356299 RepID=UPI000702E9D5|nr:nitroreductase family protein [Ferrovum sp. JA12]OYV78713.1 MAG: reductase DrgA [Ferrovum sp. 21-44-67]OYV93361.1 MAG: reductase DrgA [Ferrovum sp. 37-45-19]OZB32121.1 MAG: reductase DrgA [Ferrovum sp. 34-44-207]HQT82278.1 nitroreductase family protein [Ferrovaceae bacterium]KRH79101.1 putative NAD(P)H nitroreductase MhqN [Ferrovum sp. JA12]